MRRTRIGVGLGAMALAGMTLAGRADFGSVPFVARARVFEPTQRVLIAHNGREQILIISTEAEIQDLGHGLHEFLGRPPRARLRHWEIRGRLDSFQDDILVGDRDAFIRHLRGRPPPE